MILNTGNRTDIPAFYSKWFFKRIEEGFVYTRNPFDRMKILKYKLDPKVIDCLAFCTKNPHPMIESLEKLDKFKQFWFVTITPYGKDIEPNVPDKKQIIEDVKKLSEHFGTNAVSVRYDPILICDSFTVEKHIMAFEHLMKALNGYITDCVISFLDLYEKVKRNAPDLRPPSLEEQHLIAKEFSRIAKENGVLIHGCCEDDFLKDYGIDVQGCMTQEIIEKAIGKKLKVPKSKGKRENCNCLLGADIGEYNSCMHLCRYCYANYNKELVEKNFKNHIWTSPLLIGEVNEEDTITEAKQESWIIEDLDQVSLF